MPPGYSAKAKGYVRGYSVIRHSVNDVSYQGDCLRRSNWDDLRENRECALTHGIQFHGPAAY